MTGALQASFFDLFAVEESFDLDLDRLEQAYRTVQASVHPDRFANAPQAQRRYAAQLAARANEAVATLRDPLRRARYICELHNHDVGAENNTAMDRDFLMQQMSWRESLDEAREAGSKQAVEDLLAMLRQEESELRESMRTFLDAQANYERASEGVRRWMFIERFRDEVKRVAKLIPREE